MHTACAQQAYCKGATGAQREKKESVLCQFPANYRELQDRAKSARQERKPDAKTKTFTRVARTSCSCCANTKHTRCTQRARNNHTKPKTITHVAFTSRVLRANNRHATCAQTRNTHTPGTQQSARNMHTERETVAQKAHRDENNCACCVNFVHVSRYREARRMRASSAQYPNCMRAKQEGGNQFYIDKTGITQNYKNAQQARNKNAIRNGE